MDIGPYILIAILIFCLVFLLLMAVYPRLKRYRIVIQRTEPRAKPKKRRAAVAKKKKKSVWIKVL